MWNCYCPLVILISRNDIELSSSVLEVNLMFLCWWFKCFLIFSVWCLEQKSKNVWPSYLLQITGSNSERQSLKSIFFIVIKESIGKCWSWLGTHCNSVMLLIEFLIKKINDLGMVLVSNSRKEVFDKLLTWFLSLNKLNKPCLLICREFQSFVILELWWIALI